jgi:hypothetical protein
MEIMDEMMAKRAERLSDLGLLYNGDSFIYADINFHWTDLTCMTDEEFNKAFKGASERLEVLKKERKNG